MVTLGYSRDGTLPLSTSSPPNVESNQGDLNSSRATLLLRFENGGTAYAPGKLKSVRPRSVRLKLGEGLLPRRGLGNIPLRWQAREGCEGDWRLGHDADEEAGLQAMSK